MLSYGTHIDEDNCVALTPDGRYIPYTIINIKRYWGQFITLPAIIENLTQPKNGCTFFVFFFKIINCSPHLPALSICGRMLLSIFWTNNMVPFLGDLILNINKDTFEQLGLEGKQSIYNGKKTRRKFGEERNKLLKFRTQIFSTRNFSNVRQISSSDCSLWIEMSLKSNGY